MIPGLPKDMIKQGQEREGQQRIQRFMYMMNSMTDEELDCLVKIDRKRAERIARGSGCNLMEVGMLIQNHHKMAQVVGNLGKNKLINKGDKRDALLNQQLQRNPQVRPSVVVVCCFGFVRHKLCSCLLSSGGVSIFDIRR